MESFAWLQWVHWKLLKTDIGKFCSVVSQIESRLRGYMKHVREASRGKQQQVSPKTKQKKTETRRAMLPMNV